MCLYVCSKHAQGLAARPASTGYARTSHATLGISSKRSQCEKNYDTMRHVAEPANTFTNLGFIALSVYGLAQVHKQRLPLDVQWAWSAPAITPRAGIDCVQSV